MPEVETGTVLGFNISGQSRDAVASSIILAAREGKALCVYYCNAHSLVTARTDPKFGLVIQSADLALPDGAPVAWALRKQLGSGIERISGPDHMLEICALASTHSIPMFFLGSTDSTLQRLTINLRSQFTGLNVVGAFSPPFRALSVDEEEALVRRIFDSGARILWVGLGCPKQEIWIDSMRQRLPCVMLGVGAAFDFHAGTLQRAPAAMRKLGLEWFYRLLQEPGRLWRRYLITNSKFLYYYFRGH